MICRKCKSEFPSIIYMEGIKKTLHGRKFCLSCSPYKKNNRRSLDINRNKACTLCKKDKNDGRKYCSGCTSKIRRYINKKRAVNLLGNKCFKCSTSGTAIIFDFHHPDDNKEFTIASKMNKSWIILEPEIKKCLLLCVICHRLEHFKYNNLFLSAVDSYGKFWKNGQIAETD